MNNFRLKEIRENNENTQLEVAEVLGVKRGTYASWESNVDTIPMKQLYKFAGKYKKSIDYIVGLTDKDKVINNDKELDLKVCGSRLKELRKKHKLTQKEIAESIDINQSTWWAYEKGKTLMTIHSVIALSKEYGCLIDYLMGRI